MTTILYVDVTREMRRFVRHMFEETGSISVYLAGSGGEALALTSHHHVDAIVSAYNLPDMSGIQLLKNIRRQGIRAPFIFFTGDFGVPLKEVAYLQNVFRFNVRNGFEKKEILRLLRIVYWVTGDHEMSVMPVITDDVPQISCPGERSEP